MSRFDSNSFDIVFLMGPLYHLAEEENRIQAIREATRVLKPGGCLFGNFLMMFGMIPFLLCHYPDQEAVLWPDVQEDLEDIAKGRNTVNQWSPFVYITSVQDAKKPFEHILELQVGTIFGQESVLAPYVHILKQLPKKIRTAWYDFGLRLCEKEEYLMYASSLMVVTRKKSEDSV